jgi:protein-tyrosine phosphatase
MTRPVPDATSSPAALRVIDARNGLDQATRALKAGKSVAIPTETVVGLAFSAQSPGADRRLRDARARLRPALTPAQLAEPSTWHAPSAARVLEVVRAPTPLMRRALERLTPGPITLAIELAPSDLALVRQRLGVGEHLIDDSRALLIRVPDHPIARELAQVTALAAEAIATGTGPATSAAQAAGALESARVECELVLDAPGVRGQISTLVRLPITGGFRIERHGAMPAELIRAKLERRVLFVCTGNTCRSPMAQAIAESLIEPMNRAAPGSVPLVFSSAGLAGSGNQPTTPETLHALKHMGIEAHSGHSRQLTPALIEQADAIYAMSPSHVAGVIAMSPGAKAKVHLLDPAGASLPDPIGSAQSVYDQLARTLKPMIAQRLSELHAQSEAHP